MNSNDDGKPLPPPAATADAESTALNAQILTAGTTNKDAVVEVIQGTQNGVAEKKKPPQAGLKNYFVSNKLAVHFKC